MLKPASLAAQVVKALPAMQEIEVQALDQDDPLEEGMVIYYCSQESLRRNGVAIMVNKRV